MINDSKEAKIWIKIPLIRVEKMIELSKNDSDLRKQLKRLRESLTVGLNGNKKYNKDCEAK